MIRRPQKEARRILKEFNYSLPVDVRQIIQTLGIEIVEEPMEDSMSGMMVVKGSRAVIGINQSHHPNRQRFSLAHELGHYLLHRLQQTVFIDSSTVFFRNGLSSEGTDFYEIEANIFAAELLMPREAIYETVHQPLDAFDERALARLAMQFGVSTQALTIRLTKLNLIST